MSETVNASGSCLCGAVTITATAASNSLGACHCTTCRNWGGGPLMTVFCGDAVTIEGSDSVRVYDSSAWAERGFCSACGTHLFYRLKEQQTYHISAGLLAASHSPPFDTQVFIDQKPETYTFANETRDLTAADIFAMYAPKE